MCDTHASLCLSAPPLSSTRQSRRERLDHAPTRHNGTSRAAPAPRTSVGDPLSLGDSAKANLASTTSRRTAHSSHRSPIRSHGDRRIDRHSMGGCDAIAREKKYTFLLMSSRLLGKGLVAATKREVNRSDLRVSDSLMTRTLRTARVLPRAQRLSRARLRFGERRRARARRRFRASSRRHGWLRRRQRRRRQRCRRFRWNYGGRKRRRMRTCMATGSRDANVGKMTETFPFLSSEGLRETIAFARRGRFSLRLHVSIARERGEKSLLDATQGCPNRLRTSSRRSTL